MHNIILNRTNLFTSLLINLTQIFDYVVVTLIVIIMSTQNLIKLKIYV